MRNVKSAASRLCGDAFAADAKLADDPAVFKLAEATKTCSDKPALDLLDRQLLRLDSKKITKIERAGAAAMKLSKDGKAIYGESTEGARWIQARYDELDQGRLKSLVQALHGHAGQYKEARECTHYIWNNRRRMRYPKFHKEGFSTSTGVVEAGCKVVIGTRLKRAGMHWTVKGANAIIALRCCKLSGRLEDFWERRSDQMKAAA